MRVCRLWPTLLIEIGDINSASSDTINEASDSFIGRRLSSISVSRSPEQLKQDLQSYSLLISEFQYDRAKKVLESQKEALRNVLSNAPKNPLFTMILALINIEKSYFAMTFFFSKPYFANKDNARAGYTHLSAEIHRLLQSVEKRELLETDTYRGLLDNICNELLLFGGLRSRLLDFYANLHGIPERIYVPYQDVLVALVDIKEKLETEFGAENASQCLFPGLINSMRRECTILENFLQAHELTSNLHFLEPLIRIHQANELLKQFASFSTQSDSKLWGRSSSAPPVLVQWLQRLQSFLLSKYSLYFHDVLKRYSLSAPSDVLLAMGSSGSADQATSSSFLGLGSGTSTPATGNLIEKSVAGTAGSIPFVVMPPGQSTIFNDLNQTKEDGSGIIPPTSLRLSAGVNPRTFCMPSTAWISRITQYQKKHDVFKVAVMFDAVQQSYPYLGQGYVPPGLRGDPPSGINSFPIIYQYPLEPPLSRYDRVVLVTHVSKHLTYGAPEEWDKILREVDNSSSRLYYMSKLETRMFLLTVFDASPHISTTGGFGSGNLACTVALAVFGGSGTSTASGGTGATGGATGGSAWSVSSTGSVSGAASVNAGAKQRLEVLDANVRKFHKEFAYELRGCSVLCTDLKDAK